VAIEEIAVGDRVLSRSDRAVAGGVGFKEVRQTFVTHPAHLIHLAYRRVHCSSSAAAGRESAGPPRADGNGGGDVDEDDHGEGEPPSAVLTGTPEHPFWSIDRDAWVPLGDLAPGEWLLLADGGTGVVVGLGFEDAPAGQTFTTYNLDVADHHTYFVLPPDSADGALAVWVHNRCAAVEAAEAAQQVPGNAVKELGTGSHGSLRSREVVGDMLEHHEMPSRAAVEEAMSQRLGRPLTAAESRALQATNPSVEIPHDLHLLQDTTGGKNTLRQALLDADDLGAAQRADLRRFIETGLDHGYSRGDVARVVKDIRRMNRARGIK